AGMVRTPTNTAVAAASPDGSHVALKRADGSLEIQDLASRAAPVRLAGPARETLAVAFSREGRLLATGDRERMITLWDAGTGKPLRSLAGHRGAVVSLAFSA